ncbi:hypothetical protein P691DRAFT_609949, partial [Macrolepiota fuliginosa MF-IS2]
PLSKHVFTDTIKGTMKRAGIEPKQAHAIHSGSTLEYLLRGVPFKVMKVKGCWASDAFKEYQMKHTQILAPYMQERPDLHLPFLQHTIP